VAHSYPMESLTGGTISSDLGVNLGAAGAGVIVVFEDKHPRAFGDDKPVAIRRKRTRSALRSVVPGLSKRAQQRIAFDNSRSDRRIHAAHKKHGEHARLNMLIGIADGVGGRRATRRDHVAVAAKPK